MKLLKETEDARGRILWFLSDDGKTEIHIVEIKKGFARGGHWHPFDSLHIIIAGKIIYSEHDMKSAYEKSRIVEPVSTITTPREVAHLMIAEENSIFVEVFGREYEAVDFPPYRKVVEKKMQVRQGT